MSAMLADRCVRPELLDHLPVDEPAALGSRRDLAWINALMLQPSIMASLLGQVHEPPRRILEIGCGDGSFMLRVARRLAGRWPDVELVLLDRADLVTFERLRAFAALGWRARAVMVDALQWMEDPGTLPFDLVTANLFLHHLTEPDLRRLLAAAHRLAPAFIATEPRRNGFALAATRLLALIGANAVTLHDAPASVRAGFKGRELSELWPAGTASILVERGIGPFTHAFSAFDGGTVP